MLHHQRWRWREICIQSLTLQDWNLSIQAVPAVADLLAEVEPIFEQSEMRLIESKPEQPAVAPFASEMTSPLAEMAMEDNQSVPPRETVELVTLLVAVLVDELV